MTDGWSSIGGLAVVAMLVVAQFAKARRERAARLENERLAALAPVPPPSRPTPSSKPAAPANRAAPPPNRAAARLPQRVEAEPVPPAVGTPLLGPGRGPRWAANAIVAAEVFGPPIAARPGGTLGPPGAF